MSKRMTDQEMLGFREDAKWCISPRNLSNLKPLVDSIFSPAIWLGYGRFTSHVWLETQETPLVKVIHLMASGRLYMHHQKQRVYLEIRDGLLGPSL